MKKIVLNNGQQKAADVFIEFLLDPKEKYLVIEGPAGTGKSTLVKHLLATFEDKLRLYSILLGKAGEKYSVALTATTNKAASMVAALTGEDCSTIHSFLQLVPNQNYVTGKLDFVRKDENYFISNVLLIIDEGSYIDSDLFRMVDESTINCKVVIIGDSYQLISINEPELVMDTIPGPRARLHEVMRHGNIIAEAGAKFRHAVKTGEFCPIPVNGKEILHVDGNTFKQLVNEVFTHPRFTENTARVLAWQNITVNTYNHHIRLAKGYPAHLVAGDVVITNRPIKPPKGKTSYTTDSTVTITEIGPATVQEDIPGRWVRLGDDEFYFLPDDLIQAANYFKALKRAKEWRKFFMLQENWLDLRPGFASTVHKSQGSTYDCAFINLTDIGQCTSPNDVARMLYVAFTRAAKQVILYGSLPPSYGGFDYDAVPFINCEPAEA